MQIDNILTYGSIDVVFQMKVILDWNMKMSTRTENVYRLVWGIQDTETMM